MIRKHKLSKFAAVGTAVACAVFVLAVGATSFASSTKTTKAQVAHMVKIPGGTLTIAEAAAADPNYIFPMMGGAYFSVSNFQLIYLLCRPLYWFGVGSTPNLNPSSRSPMLPVYTNGGKTVTIKLKGYKWCNGEPVTSPGRRVLDEPAQGERHLLGRLRPGPASSPATSSTSSPTTPTTVMFTLDAPTARYWFTYNELSQVSPLPIAWDITAAGAQARLGRLLERRLHVGRRPRSDRQGHPSLDRLRRRQALRRGLRLPHGQDRGGRPWHLRHEPALADRGRARSS